MYRLEFYDMFFRYLFSSWWMYAVLGINFVVLGLLIYWYPELLSLLIAALLFFCGLIFLIISWGIWSAKYQYKAWQKKHQIIVQ